MSHIREFIIAKRDGGSLSASQIKELIDGFVANKVPDYQMSALLMAITLRGMSNAETCDLLEAMICSGIKLDWSQQTDRPIADKHSTGGVGDKTSFIVLPLLMAAGCAVPMVAGRGLGHTGGTLDKLESFDGLKTTLTLSQMQLLIKSEGGFFGGQTPDLVPADGKMYALRDVTGTVESIPLIVSSILSKKLAAGVKNLIMDVKTGDGAFMSSRANAALLARTLVEVSARYGALTRAVVTDMNTPLGCTIGNALEIAEALDILEGTVTNEVATLSLDLAAAALFGVRGGKQTFDACRTELDGHLRSGRAREIFVRVATAQGAKPAQIERKDISWLREGVTDYPIFVPESTGSECCYLSQIQTRALGVFLTRLGAGRVQLDSTINHRVGIFGIPPLGTRLSAGDPIAYLRVPESLAHEAATAASFFELAETKEKDLAERSRVQISRGLEWHAQPDV
jgi:thymidine phosphorylase